MYSSSKERLYIESRATEKMNMTEIPSLSVSTAGHWVVVILLSVWELGGE